LGHICDLATLVLCSSVAVFFCRHCFWILGDAATLQSSEIWKDIIADAKERGCFYDGNDDKDLLAAMSIVIKQDEVNRLLEKVDSRLGRGGSRSWVQVNPSLALLLNFRTNLTVKRSI
jgi:hypothetical protein